MKLSTLISLTMAATGGLAAARALARRHQWEAGHNQVAICLDGDDARAAAIRAGLPLDELLRRLAAAGASHVSLTELSLNRLLALGRLTPQAPAGPLTDAPAVGHWNYLHGEPALVAGLAAELSARLPQTQARLVGESTLAFGGDRPTIGEIGLGFDEAAARQMAGSGLALVPRPVSYAWPEPALIRRTLAQAAEWGRLVAFDGRLVLGHEMQLNDTVAAMAEHGLAMAYFAESRHQRGDWFVAKRRAPHVVLAHRLTAEEMMGLDYHAAGHTWVHLARERGIRLCYVNFFRVLHATEPLEALAYVAHLKRALEEAGYRVTAAPQETPPAPQPETRDLALASLAPAGAGAAAATSLLRLPEALAAPLALAAGAAAAALPFVEQAAAARLDAPHHHSHEHDHHDHDHDHDHGDLRTLYPPSYAPKLLALTAASLAPVAALNGRAEALIYPAAAAAALALLTSGPEYALRVEQPRFFHLDWLLPLAAAALRLPTAAGRAAALAALALAWVGARQSPLEDALAPFDAPHPQGHTHHISAATRLVGDGFIRLGPRPARKWAMLGPLGAWLSQSLARRGHQNGAAAAAALSALGYAAGLAAFRRPERPLAVTLRGVLRAVLDFGGGRGDKSHGQGMRV